MAPTFPQVTTRKVGAMALRKKHRRAARNTDSASRLPRLTTDPEADFARAWEYATDTLGLRVTGALRSGWATTTRTTMYLPGAFYAAPVVLRLAWLRHELVHALDWRSTSILRWLIAEWRWVYEVRALREQARTLDHHGHRRVSRWIEVEVEQLIKDYKLKRLGQRARDWAKAVIGDF